jgi:hypothetical protein
MSHVAPFAVGIFVAVGVLRIWVGIAYPVRARYPRLSWDYEENHHAK